MTETHYEAMAFSDSNCSSHSAENTFAKSIDSCVTSGAQNYKYTCVSRPDPTPTPSTIPSIRPSRVPTTAYAFTAAPITPTNAPLLNPASKLTYPPSSRPSINESAIEDNATSAENLLKKYLWWIILVIVSVLMCCLIGILGYKKRRKRQQDEAAAAKEKRQVVMMIVLVLSMNICFAASCSQSSIFQTASRANEQHI